MEFGVGEVIISRLREDFISIQKMNYKSPDSLCYWEKIRDYSNRRDREEKKLLIEIADANG